MVTRRPSLVPVACSMCCGDVDRDGTGSHSVCAHCGDERIAAYRLEPRLQGPVFATGSSPQTPLAGLIPGHLRQRGEGGVINGDT
jgi:hypothetical protein